MNCRFCPRVQGSCDHIGGPVAERGVALSGSRNRRSHESWVMCIVSSTMDSFFTLHQCSWRLLAALAREMQVVFWRSCLRVKLFATLAPEGTCGLLSGAVLPSAFAELTMKSMETAAIDGEKELNDRLAQEALVILSILIAGFRVGICTSAREASS